MTAPQISWFVLAGLAVYSLFRIHRHLRRLVFRLDQIAALIHSVGNLYYRGAPPAQANKATTCPPRI
jgi:hypothetical protein